MKMIVVMVIIIMMMIVMMVIILIIIIVVIIIIVKAKVNLKTSCKPILLVYSSASSFPFLSAMLPYNLGSTDNQIISVMPITRSL